MLFIKMPYIDLKMICFLIMCINWMTRYFNGDFDLTYNFLMISKDIGTGLPQSAPVNRPAFMLRWWIKEKRSGKTL